MRTSWGLPWKKVREDLQKKYTSAFTGERFPRALMENKIGHIQMLIYLQLRVFERNGTAKIFRNPLASFDERDGLGFFQITGAVILAQHKALFDDEAVPSRHACSDWSLADKRALRVAWQTAGFVEKTDMYGNLIITFCPVTSAMSASRVQKNVAQKKSFSIWEEIPEGECVVDDVECEVMELE
jgi:hypothetical protein